MTDQRIILSTAGDSQTAEDIAWALVERKLAACVNIVPISSVFRWKEEVEKQAEYLLIVKTTKDAFDRVAAALKELNSYELPECIELKIENGAPDYLAWISASVK